MSETMSTNIDETTTGPESTSPEASGLLDSDDDWSDIDLSDLEDDEDEGKQVPEGSSEPEPKADQQKGEGPEETKANAAVETKGPAEGQKEADQPTFDLKHLGEVKTVGREEVVALAQKGLNYDHIRGERDAARQEAARLSELETFLKELAAPQGMSVEDLIDSTRANVLADREKIDPSVALQRVKLERDRRAFEAEKQKGIQAKQEADQAEARRRDSFLRFAKEYPDVDPKTIPKEVWDKFGEGADLSDTYSRYENKQLKEELKTMTAKLEAEKQNNKNKTRSTGSQKSAGAESQKKQDPIDLDWYDGT